MSPFELCLEMTICTPWLSDRAVLHALPIDTASHGVNTVTAVVAVSYARIPIHEVPFQARMLQSSCPQQPGNGSRW